MAKPAYFALPGEIHLLNRKTNRNHPTGPPEGGPFFIWELPKKANA